MIGEDGVPGRPALRRGALLAGAGLGLAWAGRRALRRAREIDLDGRSVLVTGGSRGLGLLLAREFAREGCRVTICARDARELERAREAVEARGAEVLAVTCDVSDRADVDRLVEAATRRFGAVDVLVNNAGTIQAGPVETATAEDFERAMAVMFRGVLHPILAVLPQMLERGEGTIVNVTSIGGKVSVPHLLPYSCAKFAATGLSEGLRAELARHGVRVVTIAPGLMRTGSFLNAYFKGRREAEFAWFGLAASLPLVSMDAERAARQIVRATRAGEAERILSLPANLLARFHGLFPGVTADLLGIVNRLLPAAAPEGGAAPAGRPRWPQPGRANGGGGTREAAPAAGGEVAGGGGGEAAGAGGDTAPGEAVRGAVAGAERGMEVRERLQSPLLDFLMRWGLAAARRFHEHPGPVSAAGPRPA